MRRRNKKVKRAPERWQLQDVVQYDVVLCFEQRVVDALLEDMFARKGKTNRPILVVNINVKDNAVEAKRAGQEALKMCKVRNSPPAEGKRTLFPGDIDRAD